MALDRQSIEKRDFPIGRRGYDPQAVDEHLTAIANEVEELRVSARRHNESLASSASEQVRAIVEAAEASAAEILRQAEAEAREIRTEAAQEAQAARTDASTQARDYVGRVSEATGVMLQRLNAMESELSSLIDGLRTGSNRLNADLQLLEGNFEDVRESVGPHGGFEDEEPEATAGPAAAPIVAAAPAVAAEPGNELATDGVQTFEPGSDIHSPEVEAHGEAVSAAIPDEVEAESHLAEAAHDTGDGVDEDVESARLVALNMALNGTPREETEQYLTDNFALADQQALLDEVYDSVEN